MQGGSRAIDYDLVSLSSLDSDENLALRQRVNESLGEFSCTKSPTLERLARKDLWRREGHGSGRTYLFLTYQRDTIDVAGFFTVGMGAVDLSGVSNSARKKLLGDFSAHYVAGFLIAGLARSDSYAGDQLPGSVILDEAKRVIANARIHVGGRYVIVDAQPAVFEKLYQPVGFLDVKVANPPLDQSDQIFRTYMMKIKDW